MEWDGGNYSAEKKQTTIDRLCHVIRTGDMAAFTTLLGDVIDVDAQNGQLLLTCVEADQYLMAKKLLLRGADTYIVSTKIDKEYTSISKHNRIAGRTPNTEEDRPRFNELGWQRYRLATWKKEVADYATSIGTLQKIETLEAKIDELRTAVAEMTSARAPTSLKKSPAGPQR